jgi:hypothetical protein
LTGVSWLDIRGAFVLETPLAQFGVKRAAENARFVEKSRGGTFSLRLEIPQRQRDFHFFHRPDYDGLTFRFHPAKKRKEKRREKNS